MFLCACNTDQQVTAGAPDVPYDYRQRHPITMTEGDQTLQVFVGAGVTPATHYPDANVAKISELGR